MRQVIWLLSTITPSPSAASRSTCAKEEEAAAVAVSAGRFGRLLWQAAATAAACAACPSLAGPPPPCCPPSAYLHVQVAGAADVRLVVEVVLDVLVGWCGRRRGQRGQRGRHKSVGSTQGSTRRRRDPECLRRRRPALCPTTAHTAHALRHMQKHIHPPAMRLCTRWSVRPTSAIHSMAAVSWPRW